MSDATPTMSSTATINKCVSIYLVFVPIASIASVSTATVLLVFICNPLIVLYHINNANTSATKSIVNTSFAPSATGTSHQQQLQLERDPTMTMAMAIVTHRQQHSIRTWIGNLKMGLRISKQRSFININVQANQERRSTCR